MSGLDQQQKPAPANQPPPVAAPAAQPTVVVQPKAVAPAGGGGTTAPAGAGPFAGMFSNEPMNSYDVSGQQKSSQGKGFFGQSEYQNWDASGKGRGNRTGDTLQPKDKNDPNSPKQIANATQGKPDVAQAKIDDVPLTPNSDPADKQGVYREERYGTYVTPADKQYAPSFKHNSKGDSFSIASGDAEAGAREKVGVRGTVSKEGKYGSATAKGDAYADAEVGASANYSLSDKGIDGSAAASGKIGVGASGDADLKTPGVKIDGVDKPLDAGVGVHGDVFLGAKAGAGANVHLGPDGFNLGGKAGAFAGAEASADVHGNVGPVKGKFGVSGMAGAGAGIEGGISYQDGVFTMGGKMYASVGYGGSMGGEVSIDLKQAAQLAKAAGKELTPAEASKHIANGMTGGANAIDKGADGLINFLDPEHTGHFSARGLEIRGEQGLHALGEAGSKLVEGGKNAVEKGKEIIQNAPQNIKEGAIKAKDWAVDKMETAGKTVAEKAGEAKDWAKDKVNQAEGFLEHVSVQDVKDLLGEAGHSVVETGKKVGRDVMEKAGEAGSWAKEKAGQAKDWAVDKGKAGVQTLEHAGEALKDKAKSAMHEVNDFLDPNHTGHIDPVAAGKKAGTAVKDAAVATKNKAVETFHKTVESGQHAYEAAKQKATELAEKIQHVDVKEEATKAKDWAVEKAGEAKDWAVDKGKAAYEGAKEQVHQAAENLSNGYTAAKDKLKGTWGKLTSFF